MEEEKRCITQRAAGQDFQEDQGNALTDISQGLAKGCGGQDQGMGVSQDTGSGTPPSSTQGTAGAGCGEAWSAIFDESSNAVPAINSGRAMRSVTFSLRARVTRIFIMVNIPERMGLRSEFASGSDERGMEAGS